MTGKVAGTARLALLEHVPDMVTISDRRGTVLYANPATERVSGFAPEEFVGRHPFDTIHPEDRARCEEAFAELLGNPGLSLELEHRVRHKDGSWRWVEGTFASLFEDPDVRGLLATVRDVSARKEAEAALRESEKRFRALATVGSSSVYRMSPDWREMRRLDGAGFLVDTEETTTGWVDTYVPPDERPRVREAIDRAIGAKDAFELEHRVLGADGTVRWAFSRAIPLLDEAGEIAEWFGAATDVSARVKADQSFTRLFRASPAPFLILKPDAPRFTIAEVNDAYLAATMRTREEVVGRGVFEAFPDNPGDATIAGVNTLRASLERVLASRQPDRLPGLKYDIARPDGTFEERWWSPVNSAVLDENGEVEAIIHNANDVTEQHRAEAALRDSEERLRDVLDSMAEGFALLGSDFTILDVNDETLRLDGRPRDELVGRTHWEAFPGTEDSPVGGLFMRVARERVPASLEHEYNWPDGRSLWLDMRAYPTREAGVAIFWRDVTDRKRTEEALRESEEHHRLVVEGARDYAILTLDPDGRIASWSPGAEAVFGWGADEAVGRTPGFTFTPEDREAGVPEKELATALRDGSAPDVRWHARKDGSRAFIEGRTMALRRPDGGPRGFLKIGQDLTERHRAEAALRESEERYRLAADAAGIGRWAFAPETGELAGDATFDRHHGAPPGSGLGFEGHLGAVHPDDHEEIKRRVEGAIRERDGYEVEYRVSLPDGSTRFVLSRGRFVRGGDANPDRLVGVTLDVTGSRELERERERARVRELTALAEAAEREGISRELHDRVAHTMAVAHQSLELHSALAQSAPERAREKLELARESTKTALDQTRDLSAQLARRGSEETRDGLTSALRELLRTHLTDGVEGDLSAKGDEAAVPPLVKEQAYLVMREAVRNAVAHSGCGRVGVSVEVEGGELRGRVEDDGEGFEPDEIPGGESTDGEDGGPAAGIGLRSMKERTEMLNGRLEISSKPGRGTTVEVRIPLAD